MLQEEIPPLVNIGCGQDQTIAELVKIVKEVVGFTGDIVWDSSKPDGTMQKLLAIERLARLGWRPETSLLHGVEKAYGDYLGQHAQ